MSIKKRLIRTFILALIGLAVGGGIAYYQIQAEEKNKLQNLKPAPIAGINVGGPFELTDHNGKNVTQDEYGDQYKLIYFGFTYCPAICPTELQKITQAMNMLSPEMSAQIKPIFITIDPERDTVEVMREYVSLFHEDMVGLTGTPEQIEVAKKNYKIFSAKVQEEDMSDYTMDHSSFIYLMSPENKALSIYRIGDDAQHVASDIKTFLDQS